MPSVAASNPAVTCEQFFSFPASFSNQITWYNFRPGDKYMIPVVCIPTLSVGAVGAAHVMQLNDTHA